MILVWYAVWCCRVCEVHSSSAKARIDRIETVSSSVTILADHFQAQTHSTVSTCNNTTLYTSGPSRLILREHIKGSLPSLAHFNMSSSQCLRRLARSSPRPSTLRQPLATSSRAAQAYSGLRALSSSSSSSRALPALRQSQYVVLNASSRRQEQ